MKSTTIAILLSLVIAASAVANDCNNRLSWEPWIAQLERICKSHGLTHVGSAEETSAAWCRGLSPIKAFRELRLERTR